MSKDSLVELKDPNDIKNEGKVCLVTMSLPRHSGGLYKKANFTEIGRTLKSNQKVFVLRLKGE